MIYSVVRIGGKQYLVKQDDILIVDRLHVEIDNTVDVDVLLRFDEKGEEVEIGTPTVKKPMQIKIIEHMKGDKIRVAKFKSKVRYRRVRGFRPHLTKIQILA